MSTGGPFPVGTVRTGRDAATHPYLVPRSRMSKNYAPLPLASARRVAGQLYFASLYHMHSMGLQLNLIRTESMRRWPL
jgi:hypothetical protein